MQIKKIIAVLCLSLCACAAADASIVQINGKWSDDRYKPLYPLNEHFDLGCQLIQEKKWEEALHNFLVITTHFPDETLYADSLFFSGVCYYFLGDYQLSNKQLSAYLNQSVKLKYFEKVFVYKYHIAEAFRMGAKKHLFNFQSLPKILPATDEALELYDEVVSALPHQELGATALYGKAELLRDQKKYKESIETLTTLIKRFPKHPQAPIAYITISDIYLEEGMKDKQNPDLLALANVNLNHFQRDFPGDERVHRVENNIVKMEEVFATSLYDTGRFYEKKNKPKASLIYYEEAIKRYPNTLSAEKCKERLFALNE